MHRAGFETFALEYHCSNLLCESDSETGNDEQLWALSATTTPSQSVNSLVFRLYNTVSQCGQFNFHTHTLDSNTHIHTLLSATFSIFLMGEKWERVKKKSHFQSMNLFGEFAWTGKTERRDESWLLSMHRIHRDEKQILSISIWSNMPSSSHSAGF